ncbi:10187_t:CDS:1, partial [Dentiscutata erythropus]
MPICPSFINPPGWNQCRNLPKTNLLPTLIEEAKKLEAAGTVPPPYFLKIDML